MVSNRAKNYILSNVVPILALLEKTFAWNSTHQYLKMLQKFRNGVNHYTTA